MKQRLLFVAFLLLLTGSTSKAVAAITADNDIINFADAEAKRVCVENWDTNGDGELSMAEAAAVKSLGRTFYDNRVLKSFDEFQYFTGVETIYPGFSYCINLATITFPKNLSVFSSSFSGCRNLKEVKIDPSNSHFTLVDGVVYNMNRDSVVLYPARKDGTEYTIPTGTVTIGEYAFSWSNLQKIIIPSTITRIRSGAFCDCSSLSSINIPSSVSSVGSDAFYNTAWYNSQPDGLIYKDNILLATKGEYLSGDVVIDEGTRLIADNVFGKGFWGSGITSITIPNSVTCIGVEAFYHCNNLTSVVIPNSVKTIGRSAFNECKALVSVTLPNSITRIESGIFAFCRKLSSVNIPNTVTSIGSMAFYDCESLTSITIPDGVTQIEENAFCGSGLTSIAIPPSVKEIGRAGLACPNLTALYITDLSAWCGISIYGQNYVNYHPLHHARLYLNGEEVTDLVIPDGVTSIGQYAFDGGGGITSITIPSSVTAIGQCAFRDCVVTKVTSYIKEPFAIGKNVFSCVINKGDYGSNRNYTTATLYVPNGTKEKYQTTDGWKNFTNIVEMPSDSVFTAMTKEGVEMTFKIIDNDSLTCHVGDGEEASVDVNTSGEVTIPQVANGYKVRAIGRKGFYNCSKLTHIWLHEDIDSIGELAFYGCTSLRVLDIPHSVTYIAPDAFEGCTDLTLNIPYDKTDLLTGDNSGVMISLTKPSDETAGTLERIYIPKAVTTIGDRSFGYCKDVKVMVVDEENPVFDSREQCNAIIRTEENTLLYGCQNTVIPASVKTIEGYAFEGHSKLNAITIPAGMTAIGEQAFHDCTTLLSVKAKMVNPFAINDNTFDAQTYRSATLYVPVGTKAKYQATQGWKNFTNIEEMVSQEDMEPIDEDGDINFGGEDSAIDEETDLDGNMVGNIYYNIAPGDGGYDPVEGCIKVTKPTSDEDMEALDEETDIFGELASKHFTGIVFKVPAGSGAITLTAETTGGMTLKVKIGKQEPIEMVLVGKMKMKVPYTVDKPTYVYIYAGEMELNEARGDTRASGMSSLKLYGISVDSNAQGITDALSVASATRHYYTLDGRRLSGQPTRPGLYMVDGRKVIVK